MSQKITCFIRGAKNIDPNKIYHDILNHPKVKDVYFLFLSNEDIAKGYQNSIQIDSFQSTQTLQKIKKLAGGSNILCCPENAIYYLTNNSIERLLHLLKKCPEGMLYFNYRAIENGTSINCNVNDYQEGSVRENFDFGPCLLFHNNAFYSVIDNIKNSICTGFYDLRLRIAENFTISKIPEVVFDISPFEEDDKKDQHFAYVDPANLTIQREFETIFTDYLKRIGAWLPHPNADIDFDSYNLGNQIEASVIIPVKNRVKTIHDAINSVLQQKANFEFNILVIDNHSTDGTTELVAQLAKTNQSIVHIKPDSKTLGIGGCWNLGVQSPLCGKFAIQLDSDDIYKDESVIQKIVDEFYRQKCALLIGSYTITDFSLNEIPPGEICHKEWTPENGHNNALRINGFGAPRAFFKPVINDVLFPDVSYGEDYTVCLEISSKYKTGRIFEPLYICRRWEGNSDSQISREKENTFNAYKDWIRTIEICERKKRNDNQALK